MVDVPQETGALGPARSLKDAPQRRGGSPVVMRLDRDRYLGIARDLSGLDQRFSCVRHRIGDAFGRSAEDADLLRSENVAEFRVAPDGLKGGCPDGIIGRGKLGAAGKTRNLKAGVSDARGHLA